MTAPERERTGDGATVRGANLQGPPLRGPVLFLTMYPLDALNRAPKVRSYCLSQALSRLVQTTVLEGRQSVRAWRTMRLLASGRLFRFRAAYVETASASASPMDLLALALLRLLRRPVFIYVRDAYPLFAGQFPPTHIRQRISYWGWRFSVRQYRWIARKLLFPTEGLAELFRLPRERWHLLPPGGAPLVEEPTAAGTRTVAYVGPLTAIVVDLIEQAMRSVRESCGPETVCTIIASRAEWLRFGLDGRDWCRYREASRQELAAALSDADICLIALPSAGYYGLSLPVKLFDYMSLGKAVVTTRIPSVARIVWDEQIGIVADDDAESFARAIVYLFEHPDKVREFQRNALEATRGRHSWRNRAECLVEMMQAAGAKLEDAGGQTEPEQSS